jgi:hypothetical protein
MATTARQKELEISRVKRYVIPFFSASAVLLAVACAQPAQAALAAPGAGKPPCTIAAEDPVGLYGECFGPGGTAYVLTNTSDNPDDIYVVRSPGASFTLEGDESSADLDDLLTGVIFDPLKKLLKKIFPQTGDGTAVIAPHQRLIVTSGDGLPLQLSVRPDLSAAWAHSIAAGLAKTTTGTVLGENYAKGRALEECFAYLRKQLVSDKNAGEAAVKQDTSPSFEGSSACYEAFTNHEEEAPTAKPATLKERILNDVTNFAGEFIKETAPGLADITFDPKP